MSFNALITPSGGSLTDAALHANAGIQASKVIARRSLDIELAGPTTNIAAITKLLHIARTTSTLQQVEVIITGAATGDRGATVDLQKSTGGGAFATILSGTITINSSTVIRTPVAGSISSTGLVDGDILQAVVALTGSSGTQPQGLLLTLTFDENPS